MNYPVRCECGKIQRVPATLAGSQTACSCGREVEIPSLSRLKSAAGEAVFSPEVRLEQMLQLGMLPIEKDCAVCGIQTQNVANFWAI